MTQVVKIIFFSVKLQRLPQILPTAKTKISIRIWTKIFPEKTTISKIILTLKILIAQQTKMPLKM